MQNRFDNLTVKVVFKDILTRDKNELRQKRIIMTLHAMSRSSNSKDGCK